MADKLEVLPGPGLVARFGDVAVWAGPQCSPALQAHLVSEAQKQGPYAGDQLASSFIAVLQRGDPEPQAPFAIVGPGANGLALFLHGPVQAWDSGRWLAPQPVPGWMATSIGRPWPLIILPYGAAPPPQSQQGNPFDLLSGAVPGSGFVLLRPPPGPGQASGTAQATGSSLTSPGAAQPGPGAGGPVPFGGQPGYGAQPERSWHRARSCGAGAWWSRRRCRVALGRANRRWQRRPLRSRARSELVRERRPIRARWAPQRPAAERSTYAVSSPRCSRRSRSHRALRLRSAQTDRRCKGYVASSGISITLA